ncbi:hypothetical protein D3C72_1360880 [compost metagenome]
MLLHVVVLAAGHHATVQRQAQPGGAQHRLAQRERRGKLVRIGFLQRIIGLRDAMQPSPANEQQDCGQHDHGAPQKCLDLNIVVKGHDSLNEKEETRRPPGTGPAGGHPWQPAQDTITARSQPSLRQLANGIPGVDKGPQANAQNAVTYTAHMHRMRCTKHPPETGELSEMQQNPKRAGRAVQRPLNITAFCTRVRTWPCGIDGYPDRPGIRPGVTGNAPRQMPGGRQFTPIKVQGIK